MELERLPVEPERLATLEERLAATVDALRPPHSAMLFIMPRLPYGTPWIALVGRPLLGAALSSEHVVPPSTPLTGEPPPLTMLCELCMIITRF